jgi:superfamily II DNA or RNA helicase
MQNDAKKQERRRRELKLREAEERKEEEREQAGWMFSDARAALRDGDLPAAARLAKKALVLDSQHLGALDLLSRIYFEADEHAVALPYIRQVRKLRPDEPGVAYNSGVALQKSGRSAEALAEFEVALALIKQGPKGKRAALREAVESACRQLKDEIAKPAPPVPKPSPPPPTPLPAAAPEPAAKPEPPRVRVTFLAPPPLEARATAAGTLSDYFLRRGLQALRLAQSFEDLVCLPSLTGVDSYVYQHETVRKVLRHFKGRALLADEVGLGKTIEACLVLKEYWARGMVRKALVLAPPSLVSQWKGELAEKFGCAPASPDGAEFRRDPERFWKNEPLIVASIAMARLEPHAAALAGTPWDMVIVDEAHCLKNRASSNWKLVDALEKKFILMLTATPVENNLIELYNLITLLKPGLLATEAEFRKQFVNAAKPKAPKNPERLRALLAEVMVRNTRSAVDVRLPHRVAASVVVAPSAAEAELYERVSTFVAERYKPGEHAGAMTLGWLQRQAGSSPQALSRSIARRLAGHEREDPHNIAELEGILDLASHVGDGSKGMQLGEMLSARQAKTVVFTEFVPTLEHLAEVCRRRNIRYALFSGDLSRAEKDAAIARFRDEADVLLSTGAGGEGRNLQFADTVINFDLPWNPMRLEQRVGRVHRIGQERDVFIFNFCQAGSVEEHLLRVLHDKVNMFELVVGEMDAILGSLDDARDFAEVVMDLWISARQSGAVDEAFDDLGRRLLAAKAEHAQVKELDEALFHRDFEV